MYNASEIAFPGLGIGEFTVNRVAFKLFGREVAWYGLIIAIGMIVAVAYVIYRTREYVGINTDDVIDFTLFVIIFGVIGARLYYVLTSDYDYTFLEAFEIWNGGLAIYGGIIGGGLAALAVCYVKKIRPQCFFDMLAPGVMIAQAIGRWGNFCNGEAYGSETALPWGMKLSHVYSADYVKEIGTVHPTFLYESLWNVLGFVLINLLYRKRKFDGQIILTYFAWYGFGRMFIEGLRTDSLYVGPFRISQVVGLLSCLAAVICIVVFWNKGRIYDSVSLKDEIKNTDEKED